MCEVLDRSTTYYATSSASSWRVFCEKQELIAMTLFFKKVFSCLRMLTTLTSQDVSSEMQLLPFCAIERESTKMDLEVNEDKIKYMLSTGRVARRIDSQITADNYTFDMSVWRSNAESLLPTSEFNRHQNISDLYHTTKLILYKTPIIAVLLYGP